MVLDNQTATLQVGDEVPVVTQQQQSTVTDTATLVNTIEYRDTGVLLNVKPRVNAGGLVIMEVEQEVSNIPTTNNADPLTPRIQQRKITSTVAVNSGDTIVLGGLIQDDRDRSESGIPLLHKLPLVGALFGNKADNQKRTELIVLITPRAISNSTAALQVTEEYRRRLQKLIPSREPDPDLSKSKQPVTQP
jgi:general secretion pathway protein D